MDKTINTVVVHFRERIVLFQEWLIALSVVIFGLAGALKLLQPILEKVGIVDAALANELPLSLNYSAAILEVFVVLILLMETMSKELKLQVLCFMGVSLIAFRLFAFGTLFPPDCGCFGPILTFSGHFGRAFELLSGLFICSLPFGYVSYAMYESVCIETAAKKGDAV